MVEERLKPTNPEISPDEQVRAKLAEYAARMENTYGEQLPNFIDPLVLVTPNGSTLEVRVPKRFFDRLWFREQRQVEQIQTFLETSYACQVAYQGETVVFKLTVPQHMPVLA